MVRLLDPDNPSVIMDQFTVCGFYVMNIYKLLSTVGKKTPFKLVSAAPALGTCDLVPGQSKLTLEYLQLLIYGEAESTLNGKDIDLTQFHTYVRYFAHTPERRRTEIAYGDCYIMPAIPNFAICPECFVDLAQAEVETGFRRHVYSNRMRDVLLECLRQNDLNSLRSHVEGQERMSQEFAADGFTQENRLSATATQTRMNTQRIATAIDALRVDWRRTVE
ncbi:uncharacterized protein BDR25DRAFT_372487 [Lindgomyces ingoldianus]|uniref:Uncharacterized protein n=1 Tax=Lindgomyces ingoldianus TaxID=673940 RepID=A0ACB6QRF5_9PLEO|nr:uncharacterized protein BDR25DRAFT_372487 [Lindgomyces ingoldianus]KAF2468680.1 hypothetical protein BDR25DRAFT_372487 [Lindgomyces ingoldianus]